MSNPTLEPTPKSLSGDSPAAHARRLLLATRPKFLTASLLPVVVGFAWGYRAGGKFDALVFALAMLATALVHAASNVYNDVGDDINGTDQNNAARIHPYTGGSRFIQNGVMSRTAMMRLSIALFAVAIVAGLILIELKGLTVLWLGLAGIGLGVLYSMPRLQLSAHGLGELAVVIAFGVLPVSGATWLIAGRVDAPALWIALAVGLWVGAILQINEVPDIAADEKAGKRTLAVRLRERGVARLYLAMHAGALAIVAGLVLAGHLPMGILILPVILLLVAVRAAMTIVPPPHPALVRGIEMTLAIQLLGCVWLALWFVFSA